MLEHHRKGKKGWSYWWSLTGNWELGEILMSAAGMKACSVFLRKFLTERKGSAFVSLRPKWPPSNQVRQQSTCGWLSFCLGKWFFLMLDKDWWDSEPLPKICQCDPNQACLWKDDLYGLKAIEIEAVRKSKNFGSGSCLIWWAWAVSYLYIWSRLVCLCWAGDHSKALRSAQMSWGWRAKCTP